jgi:hypothetical protein
MARRRMTPNSRFIAKNHGTSIMTSLIRRFLSVNTIAPITLLAVASATAQNPVDYWVHQPELPNDLLRARAYDFAIATDGTNTFPLIAGFSNFADGSWAPFLYDHSGAIDPDSTFADQDPASPLFDPNNPNDPIPGKYWSMAELVGPNPFQGDYVDYNAGQFLSLNSSGLVLGWFSIWDVSGEVFIPAYLDLRDPVLELKLIPFPLAYDQYSSWRPQQVNEAGDMLFTLQEEAGGPRLAYIFSPVNGAQIQVPLQAGGSTTFFNSARQIVSTDANGIAFRYSILAGDGSGIMELFPEIDEPSGLNEAGQFTGTVWVDTGSDKGAHSVRYGGQPGTAAEERRWSPVDNGHHRLDNTDQSAAINNSGDAVDAYYFRDDLFYFHEGDPLVAGDEVFYPGIKNWVIPESDPDCVFVHGSPGNKLISDRDATGFAWIAITVNTTENADGSQRREVFLLEPMTPTIDPGISVSPTSGLITSESGGTASFDVVLDTEPAADVTIGITSSDASEGTVNKSSLTFTPGNWHIPQIVKVTGQDDDPPVEDGDIAYTIFTGPATSTDPDYQGRDAPDVSVTNLDNETPSSGNSSTYGSADTPLNIPDYDPGGVASSIVAGDHLITNLTVNVNITHPDPSELNVYLAGPGGGPAVELFNFSGDNQIPDFNGTSSLGLWTLEVYDTVRKKKGKLNSWSISVDH